MNVFLILSSTYPRGCGSHPLRSKQAWSTDGQLTQVDWCRLHRLLLYCGFPLEDLQGHHWNENVVNSTKFSLLAALEVVKMTTSSAASDENVAKMTTIQFQWIGPNHSAKETILYCTDLAKSSWTFFSGAYFTILCCTETYHNFTTYFTTTLVLMFWISQAYAIASCISAYFCDVAYALLKIKFGRDANRISMTSHRDRC